MIGLVLMSNVIRPCYILLLFLIFFHFFSETSIGLSNLSNHSYMRCIIVIRLLCTALVIFILNMYLLYATSSTTPQKRNG